MIGGGDDVVVLLNGAPYSGWLSIEVQQDFDQASGTGTIVLSEQRGVPLPAKVGYTAVILCAGKPVITGHVHKISVSHDKSTHTITAEIRDKTQDLVDSTVGPGLKKKPPCSLKEVCEETIKHMGLSGIKVIDKVSPPNFKPAEVPVADIEDRGFGFLDKWAKKRSVLFNTDGKGNLVIDRNQKRRGPGMLFKSFEDHPLNNVLKCTYETQDYGAHNTTAAATQKSPNDMDYWEGRPKSDGPAQAGPLSKAWGAGMNSAIRPERVLHFRAAQGLNEDSPEKAAKWRASTAKGRNYTYAATVQGFEMSPGTLWWPGYIIPVRDDHCELSDELLIKSVTFRKDWDGGATTEVSCAPGDSFAEESEEKSSRSAKSGAGNPAPGTHGGVGKFSPTAAKLVGNQNIPSDGP